MSKQIHLVVEQLNNIALLLKSSPFPNRFEPNIIKSTIDNSINNLANAYFAIVAICHQTSPIGERPLEGFISNNPRKGWDYLKEKFLIASTCDSKWLDPRFWQCLNPITLANLYKDDEKGLTLSRISERTFLLNNLGDLLITDGYIAIEDAFIALSNTLGGSDGFISYLSRFEAYSDPLFKKTFLFLSLANTECGWQYIDPENIHSPIDYHELRGHLRLGTIDIAETCIQIKLKRGLSISSEEDFYIRQAVQEANEYISRIVGVSNSELHYFLWNVFRSCCSRQAEQSHCLECSPICSLPESYRIVPYYHSRCIFSELCPSVHNTYKIVEPAYLGHYY
ncbi:MAG: hypothetical protein A2Y53_08585 [Chloroflexi bacterium RBG_16_47_49]|nr:MAG: hypothetical protein A2Y53_08585 [Chloroflexi bacterium RBG_16_47_49]